MLDQAYADATEILSKHHDQLNSIASLLLEEETIDSDQFQQALGRTTSPGATETVGTAT